MKTVFFCKPLNDVKKTHYIGSFNIIDIIFVTNYISYFKELIITCISINISFNHDII